MKILRLRSGCGRDPDRLAWMHPSGSDHGDRGDRAQARRFPLEGGVVSVCSTKSRRAAHSPADRAGRLAVDARLS